MKLQGNLFKYGDNVNTDVIIPARYLNSYDNENLKKHCMEDLDKSFCQNVKQNDIIVGGFNFGSGSSREHAPLAIKASGIQAVVAKSFARIFYRNAINIGLFVIEDEKICNALQNAECAVIDYENKTITTLPQNDCFKIELPDFVNDILKNGGLINAIKKGDFNV